jgi:hypothetical protein
MTTTPVAQHHYVIVRRDHGWTSGPSHGVSYPDTVQVMAASRTEHGARIAQRKLGGTIRRLAGPYRRYSLNEEL